MNFTILRFDSLGSTNDEALRQARRGAAEGVCVVAKRQTAGRGRYGRTWVSPEDAGLYFSVVLRPFLEARFLPLITLMTGVAVHDTLEETFGLDCDVKWSNDIHVRGRKICGILAETAETAGGLAVVVGIGINLNSANFPAEIADAATSIEQETGAPADYETLLSALTVFFARFCDLLYGADGAETIRQEWARRSSYHFGKEVRARLENGTLSGTTRGIEPDGALRLETETGEIKIIRAGEIENLRSLRARRA